MYEKKQYDNNVLVGTSRQGPALTDAPRLHNRLTEHLSSSPLWRFELAMVNPIKLAYEPCRPEDRPHDGQRLYPTSSVCRPKQSW